MAENSKIEWTDHTWNPWWGCVKVSPACTHCYAATLAHRYGTEWGPQAQRRFFRDKHWQEPVKWNRKAEREGRRMKVFCASMADVFEELPADHPDRERMTAERVRLFTLIDATPHLDWLLLTKRPENIRHKRFWPPVQNQVNFTYRSNVWLGCTVEDQANADRRIPELLKCRDLSPVLFLSCEPLLGPVDIGVVETVGGCTCGCGGIYGMHEPFCGTQPGKHWGIDWVIAGGESGPHARPSHPDWFRSLREQCSAAGVAFHFKQWGDWALAGSRGEHCWNPGASIHDIITMDRVGKKIAGRLLDGREWNEMPKGVETCPST